QASSLYDNVTDLWRLQPTVNCPCDRCSLVITPKPSAACPSIERCCKVIGPAAGKAGFKARSRPELRHLRDIRIWVLIPAWLDFDLACAVSRGGWWWRRGIIMYVALVGEPGRGRGRVYTESTA